MPVDATPAAPETAPAPTAADQFVGAGDVAGYRAARRAERSGQPLDVPAESSPAQPGDQAASTDASTSAASEPAKPKKVNNADTRVTELLAEREALRAELDTLKRPRPSDAMPAKSSPATVADAEFPELDDWLAIPGNEGKSFTAYQREFFRHEFQQQQAETNRKAVQTAQQRDQDERITAYRKSAETFIADHDDYWPVVTPITSTPRSDLTDALGEVITRSANPPALLYKLGSEPETWARLIGLPERLAVYELGKLEAALSAPETPKTQPLTRAKEPPTTLGRRAADPGDVIEAAVASGDVARFRAEKLKQRIAGQR